MSDTDTAKTADLASKSGLFSSAPAQKPPSAPKTPKNTAKQPKQPAQTEKTPHNPPASDLPCDSTDVNSPEIPANPAFSDSETRPDTKRRIFRLIQSIIPQDVFDRTQQRTVNRTANIIAGQLTDEIDRYRRLAQAASKQKPEPTPPRAGFDTRPPTREELIGIVSAALRAENATGSDVKGLTATLQSLLPDLFSSGDQSKRPDPSAIIQYVTTFAGRKGSEIVADLGGRESMEARLSEILGLPVKLGDSAP